MLLGKDKKLGIEGLPGGPVVKTCAPNAGGAGLIPGQGAKIHPTCCMVWPKKKKKKS